MSTIKVRFAILGTVLCLMLLAGLAVAGGSGVAAATPVEQAPSSAPAARPEAPLASITRTLVYHELPLPGLDGVIAGRMDLSADGTRIAFVGGYNPNTIYVIEANGQGLRQVDSYEPSWHADSSVDLSADGSKVLSWDGGTILRLANANGGGAHQVITIEGGYKDFHLSTNGERVTFIVDRDWSLQPGNQPKKAGVYTVNGDGSNLKQLVTAEQIAALFGTTPADFPFSGGPGRWIDVSDDGQRIVFMAQVRDRGLKLFRVGADGGGLQAYDLYPEGYYWRMDNVRISGDGSTVLYTVAPNPCCSTPTEWGVVNYDGSDRRTLFTGYSDASYARSVGLTQDGAFLSVPWYGRLVKTDGSGEKLDLALWGGMPTNYPGPIIDGYCLTMNADGTRFAYLDWTGGYGYPKLATLTINPPSLGPAPQIDDVLMTPVYLLTEGRSEAKVTARVVAASSPGRVGSVALLDDVQDRTVQEGVLVDGGSAGDAKPGDGIYTASPIRTTADAVTTGPRTMRVVADVVAADGTRHSTAVDVAAFDVRADHPSATIPPETGGVLNYVDGRGNTTVITVPPWAFNTPTVLWLIPLPGVTPPNERATQRAFELLARQGSVVVSTPNKAVTVSIEYADEEIAGLDEAKLRLKRFVEDGNQWVEAGCGPYTRLLGENTVKVSLCHFSRFDLFEDATQQLFLPVVQRP